MAVVELYERTADAEGETVETYTIREIPEHEFECPCCDGGRLRVVGRHYEHCTIANPARQEAPPS